MKRALFLQAVLLTLVTLTKIGVWAEKPHAEGTCKPIRLDTPGKSMAPIPVMDQSNLWICYAFDGAQMADAWRFSHGDVDYSHLTSPIATAVFETAQRSEPPQDLDFGWPWDALNSIAKNGSCDYQMIYEKNGQNHFSEYFAELHKNFDSKKSDATYLKFLETLFKDECNQNTLSIALPEPTVVMASSIIPDNRIPTFRESISQQLESPNPQPMAVSYCEDALYVKNVMGVNLDGSVKTERCRSHHASLIIGQRPTAEGGCEYLLRNSHGKSCDGYLWKCEDGELWIDSKAMARNMTSLSWLQDN